MPFTEEQLKSIKEYGCFEFHNPLVSKSEESPLDPSKEPTQEPIFFKINSRYHMGRQVLKNKYNLWKKSVDASFRYTSDGIISCLKSVNPIACIKSFFLSLVTNKNHKSKFAPSARVFKRYDTFCNNQVDAWRSFVNGIKNRFKSLKDYNKRKYDEYTKKLEELTNKIAVIPVGLSRMLCACRFYSWRLTANIFLVIGKIIATICGFIRYLIKTLYNIVIFGISIVAKLIWNTIIHVLALISFCVLCVLYVIVLIFWPIIRVCGFFAKTFLRIYYFLMYGIIRLFNMLPDVITPDMLNCDMYFENNRGKTFRQLLIIDKPMYDGLRNNSGVV